MYALVVESSQVIDIVSKSIVAAIYVIYMGIVLIPLAGWKSWKLWHWMLDYHLSPDSVRCDIEEKRAIRARVPMYICLWLLFIYCIVRFLGIVGFAIPDFIWGGGSTAVDGSLGLLKAFAILVTSFSDMLQYHLITMVVIVWHGACMPFYRSSSVESIPRYKRKEYLIAGTIVAPGLFLGNISALVAAISTLFVVGIALDPIYGVAFAIEWYKKLCNTLFRVSDLLFLVSLLYIGVCFCVLMYVGIRERRIQSVSEDKLVRQKFTFVKISLAIVVIFILLIYRNITLVTLDGRVDPWLYSLVTHFMVESLLFFVIVGVFWPFGIPRVDMPIFNPIQFVVRFDDLQTSYKFPNDGVEIVMDELDTSSGSFAIVSKRDE